MPVVITCVRGADVRRRLTLRTRDPYGDLVAASYAGTPALAADVWPGDARATTFAPTLTWIDPAAGTVEYAHSGAQTEDVAPGTYKLIVSVTTGDGTDKHTVGDVEIQGSPGSDEAPRAYCTDDDLYDLAPWLDDLQSATDQSGFIEQRSAASRWADEQALARAEVALDDQRRAHGAVVEVDAIAPTSGADYGPGWGRSVLPDATVQTQLDAIQARLDADGLEVSSRVRRATARYAVHLVLDAQVGDRDGTSYQALGGRFRARAIRELGGAVLRVLDDEGAVAYVLEG